MNKIEELDGFIDTVNDIHDQIKGLIDGSLTAEDIDKKRLRYRDVALDKEAIKAKKEEEEKERIKNGSSGKGEGEEYQSFCKRCFIEYTLETPLCVHCSEKTITRAERFAELMAKVEVIKKKRADKEKRKYKWDQWKKTQAIYWKKTSTNYSKWDYFTSSDEDEDPNDKPILPKNDPNFLAMEKDLDERMKKREEDRKAALEFKAEGNEHLKKRDYLKAIELYTLGMERLKDMKELYTNRALAYLKLGDYEKCITDCSNMLEFTEVFEKGYEKSAETCLKVDFIIEKRLFNMIDRRY